MAFKELVNELSWSKTRHGRFEECLRAYWYQYYGSWGGWEASAAAEVREAYVLKNLASRQQWAGSVVHASVAAALGAARLRRPVPTADELVEQAHSRMREDFRLSRQGAYRRRPKKTVGLVEHELNEPVSEAEWKANWENAERCLRNFHASGWLERARALAPEDWLPIDEIGSFLLEGIKVFAGPDFAFRDGEGTVLVDWKTGAPRPEDQAQVQGYALFAAARWGAEAERVVARLAYLSTPTEVEVRVDPPALDEFRGLFKDSIGRMRARLRDPANNVAVRDDFPLTDDLHRCRHCVFRRPCGREAAARPA